MKGQDLITRIVERLHQEFGPKQTVYIIRALAEEIGGVRISFPDLDDLYRMERDQRITTEYNGANLHELAQRYRLHHTQVRRIVCSQGAR